MREGRLLEALGAVKKPPWSADDWLAERGWGAVCLSGPHGSEAEESQSVLHPSGEWAYEGGERPATPCAGIRVGLEQAARGLGTNHEAWQGAWLIFSLA